MKKQFSSLLNETKADWEMADSFNKSFSLIVHYLPAEKAAV